MTEKKKIKNLVETILCLNDSKCLELVQELLDSGVEAFDIISAFQESLEIISKKYEKGEYYIAGLIMAGEIMNQVMELLNPLLLNNLSKRYLNSNILIGTVFGDIHDLGKNMAGALLFAYGFQVHDLGVDVSPELFLEKIEFYKPNAVGISSLLSSNYNNICQTISFLKENLSDDIKPVYFLSGPSIKQSLKKKFGVDYIVTNVVETVRLCEKISLELEKKIDNCSELHVAN